MIGRFCACLPYLEFTRPPAVAVTLLRSNPLSFWIRGDSISAPGAVEQSNHCYQTQNQGISIGTAWLYSQFRAGTLTLDIGSGSYFDANRLANTGKVQNAIWFLEGEGGQNNGYVALAETALGTNLAGIEADSNGAYGVVVL